MAAKKGQRECTYTLEKMEFNIMASGTIISYQSHQKLEKMDQRFQTLDVIKQKGESDKRHHNGNSGGVTHITHTTETTIGKYIICKGLHKLYRCPEIWKIPVNKRFELVKKHKGCYKCLGLHENTCLTQFRCRICGENYNTLLHVQGTKIRPINAHTITENKLKSKMEQKIYISTLHVGLGVTTYGVVRGQMTIHLVPKFELTFKLQIYALIQLTNSMLGVKVMNDESSVLQGFQVADPTFDEPGKIDLLQFINKDLKILPTSGCLSTMELNIVLYFWIRNCQMKWFPVEYSMVINKNTLIKSKFVSILDKHGIMRVGGHLENANLPYQHRHPSKNIGMLIKKRYMVA